MHRSGALIIKPSDNVQNKIDAWQQAQLQAARRPVRWKYLVRTGGQEMDLARKTGSAVKPFNRSGHSLAHAARAYCKSLRLA
jgi:hypothetical protein